MILLWLLVAASIAALPLSTAAADFDPANNRFPGVGVEEALKRARAFNARIAGKTPEQLAEEFGEDLYTVILDPYGNAGIPGDPVQVNPGDTWQDCMDKLFEKYGTDTYRVGIGYYNPLTQEEQYVNGDKYMISASMFKIPTNMIYGDMVSSGEISLTEDIYGAPYSYYEYETIVNSSNSAWMTLISYLGGYEKFKKLQIPYLGNNPEEDLGWNYYVDNYYNAQQFIHMLRMLYDDPERFPGIIECMLEATPFAHFREYEHRYPIAQKYGFVSQTEGDGAEHTYVTCCGIVYTDTPFMIVMFTDNVSAAYSLLGEYAVVMADYTNMVAAEEAQKTADAKQAEEAAVAALSAQLEADVAAVQDAVQATPKPIVTETVETRTLGNFSVIDCLVMGWVVILMITCFVLIFRHNMAGRINGFWAALAVIFAGSAMILCVIALRSGTLIAKPSGNPAETVNQFFSAVSRKDYDTAYSCLSDYESLGIENQPATEESRMLYDALVSSYDYALRGDCVRDRLSATQSVSFRYLNLNAVKKEAEKNINSILKNIVETRTNSQVFDSNGGYLQSVTDEVYRKAVAQALSDPSRLMTSAEFPVHVEYRDGKWLMSSSDELITALLGGAS